MKNRFYFSLLFLLVLAGNLHATSYFIAPASGGGSDSNNGTSPGTPWLTPNHAVNCGDLLTAAAGTYAEANFRLGNWGVVTCPLANNVAWLKCATFDACKIVVTTAGHDALGISQSFWGVQGFEVQVTTFSTNQCFQTFPPNNTTQIHHIIFANNVANGCGDGAFTVGAATTTVGVDYVVIVGNIAYNGAQDNTNCYSGIDMVFPVNSDTVAGTHIYIAGNYAWGNVDPNPCGGITPTDGHGISLDSLSQSSYSGQIVAENNISVFNGASGFQNFSNNAGLAFVRQNTIAGNQTGTINANPCAELTINTAVNTNVSRNLVATNGPTACVGAVTLWAFGASFDATSDTLTDNFLYSAAGNNFTTSNTVVSGNKMGTNPNFVNPVQPGAPSCGSSSSVPNCVATIVSNFAPQSGAALSYGYQTPSTTANVNPFYPAWLCTVTNLPTGLVTPGCAISSGLTNGSILNGSIVN